MGLSSSGVKVVKGIGMRTNNERVTAQVPTHAPTGVETAPMVVFLIGMRVNAWWKVWKWLPVVFAMPRMIVELSRDPALGFMGANSWFGRTTIMVSYWRSLPDLLRYAHARDRAHLPAWQAFDAAVGVNGDVGIWHETYEILPGHYENVYVNMPPFGLGAAVGTRAASETLARAAGRLAHGASPRDEEVAER